VFAVRFRLLPSDDKFFEMFNAAAVNVAECSRRLRELVEQPGPGGSATIDAVVACERHGDELTRDILRRLNTSFVTPFDREDIHALAEELDDVVDDMLEVAYRLELADRNVAAMPELKQQADVLVLMADEVVGLIAGLEPMQGLQPHLDAVDRLESEGDTIYRHALQRLYSDEFKARASLYWKDVVEAMENALDTIEDISDVVEAIALKHA
jgi:predicted phosphate transport protein (TIGR00153 family)